MNTRGRSGDGNFDDIARGVHARALASVSPRTLAQLQWRRAAAPAGPRFRGYAWPLATVCAVAALAIGWQLRRPEVLPAHVTTVPAPLAAAPDDDGATLALDENPELFEWLASSDAAALAME